MTQRDTTQDACNVREREAKADTGSDGSGRETGGAPERAPPIREQETRVLVEHLPDAIARHDMTTRIAYCNRAWKRLLGCAQATPGSRVGELLPGHPAGALYQRALDLAVATGEPAEFDAVFDTGDGGRRIEVRFRIVPHTADDGTPVGLIVFGRDLAWQKNPADDLWRRTSEWHDLVEYSPDYIARYDADCRRVYANARLMALLGGDPAEVLGKTPADVPGVPGVPSILHILRDVLERGEVRDVKMRWRAGGDDICHQVRMWPQFDAAGRVTHVLAVGRDVSEIDRCRKQLYRQSFYDRLTGLPNRELLCDRMSEAIADAQYHGRQFAVMIVDLDHFKNVNDSLGHRLGDRLLCAASRRVQDCVQGRDLVAHLGGDEFAVLLSDTPGVDDAAAAADRIRRHLADPFLVDGRELFITGSIGIAMYPADGVDIDALFKFADSALHHAKKLGRNNFQFYAREFTARSRERMDMELALRKALKHGELELYYQPQVDLRTGGLVGAEALLRWHRPGHGLVGPDEFIAIAEESGLILDIGTWVLSRACEAAARWNRERTAPFRIAVNLSPRQFVRHDLAVTVSRVLLETGCKSTWLTMEITENLLLEDDAGTVATLAALDAVGVGISIDDFGTGYSALSYLHRFPVRHLKIDRSFVNGIESRLDKRELVKCVLAIAAALNHGAVAEGVETAQQADYLKAQGCRVAQGYLFGKPMPAAAFETMLKTQNPLPDMNRTGKQ